MRYSGDRHVLPLFGHTEGGVPYMGGTFIDPAPPKKNKMQSIFF